VDAELSLVLLPLVVVLSMLSPPMPPLVVVLSMLSPSLLPLVVVLSMLSPPLPPLVVVLSMLSSPLPDPSDPLELFVPVELPPLPPEVEGAEVDAELSLVLLPVIVLLALLPPLVVVLSMLSPPLPVVVLFVLLPPLVVVLSMLSPTLPPDPPDPPDLFLPVELPVEFLVLLEPRFSFDPVFAFVVRVVVVNVVLTGASVKFFFARTLSMARSTRPELASLRSCRADITGSSCGAACS